MWHFKGLFKRNTLKICNCNLLNMKHDDIENHLMSPAVFFATVFLSLEMMTHICIVNMLFIWSLTRSSFGVTTFLMASEAANLTKKYNLLLMLVRTYINHALKKWNIILKTTSGFPFFPVRHFLPLNSVLNTHF